MSKPSIPVIKFLFRQDHRVLGEALGLGSGYEVENISNSNDLSNYLATIPAGLVVTSLHDKNDLVQIATFMKLGRKVAKDCAIKVVVFNFSKDRTFEKAIAKLGILDLVEPRINTKALKFKIDFWMKSLTGQIKKNGNNNPQKLKSLDQKKESQNAGVDNNSINWLPELELEEDIWLLKNDNDCKKIMSKWLVRLVGPSPYVGQWSEVKSGLWRFDIKESEKELFVPSDGAWFFSGDQKPDFVWKENNWLISGDNFDLFFKSNQSAVSRLNCKNRVIQVCKNSMFAKTKEEVIIESFDKELVFKREAAHLDDLQGKNNTDHLNGGNLQGKGDTDEIDGGPLEGKNTTPAEISGNLKGKTKGEMAIEHENLEQNTSTSKEKSHWGNKNSHEEERSDQLGVRAEKHRRGNNLERENTNSEHQKYYKNHNESEQYESGELGKGLHGKSSTDELPGHYDNSKKPGDKNLNPAHKNDLGGDSETEKIKSHYGRKEDGNSNSKDDENDPRRASSTDKHSSHYGKTQKGSDPGNNRPVAESSKNDERGLGGKGSTDKLSSHYGRSNAEKSERNTADREKPERNEERGDWNPTEKENSEISATRKNESEKSIEQSQKTSLYNNFNGKHDFGFKSEEAQLYNKQRNDEEENKGADVLSLNKAREEKARAQTQEELALEKITEDAKIVSLLVLNGRKIECGLDDFFEDTVIFHTENQDINPDSGVNLDLKFKYLGKETLLKIDGNVSSIESDGEGKKYVSVQLTTENSAAFEKFMKLYQIRQQSINVFLKKAKGL